MKKNNMRERLSIDILPKEHKAIKVYATLEGKTIREFVLEGIKQKISEAQEQYELSEMTLHLEQDPVLMEVWNNEKDGDYDKL